MFSRPRSEIRPSPTNRIFRPPPRHKEEGPRGSELPMEPLDKRVRQQRLFLHVLRIRLHRRRRRGVGAGAFIAASGKGNGRDGNDTQKNQGFHADTICTWRAKSKMRRMALVTKPMERVLPHNSSPFLGKNAKRMTRFVQIASERGVIEARIARIVVGADRRVFRRSRAT
jgi:hypothetical protein